MGLLLRIAISNGNQDRKDSANETITRMQSEQTKKQNEILAESANKKRK